jgi:hypothetical protein
MLGAVVAEVIMQQQSAQAAQVAVVLAHQRCKVLVDQERLIQVVVVAVVLQLRQIKLVVQEVQA